MKTYKINITCDEGKTSMFRENDGFNAFELLGFISLIHKEIIDQIKGELAPTIIQRNFIE